MFPPHKLVTLSFSVLLVCATTACGQGAIPLTQTSQPQTQTSNNYGVFTELNQAQIIYLGEVHSNPQDHEEQLRLLIALHQKNPKLAIAVEMFQRPFQKVVNSYLAGEIDEDELLRRTEYEQRWGYNWRYYAPILRYAKEHNLPVVAMNTPAEITRKVAQAGLENLKEAEQVYIPPLDQIRTDSEFAPNQGYRHMLAQVFAMHGAHGHSGSEDDSDAFERFFAAQVLWDETMAESIVNFHQQQPDYQILVIAGQGHIVYDYGIPSRVERRLAAIANGEQPTANSGSELVAVIKQKEPLQHQPRKNGITRQQANATNTPEPGQIQQATVLFGNPEDVIFAEHGADYGETAAIADYFWQYDGGLKVKSVSRINSGVDVGYNSDRI
jgi:uncharacterized iron-regulated protein